MSERRMNISGRLFIGLIIITVGVLFTLDNLDLVESEPFLRYWPALMLAVGVYKLSGIDGRSDRPGGLVLTVVGGLLLASSLDLLNFSVWRLWPVGLVAFGASVVWRSMQPSRVPAAGVSGTGEAVLDESSRMSIIAFWSGVTRRSTSQTFERAEVTAVMGGAEIDLRGARAHNGRAIVDVMVMMGGLEIRVDDTWRVVSEGIAVMGAIEDSTKSARPDAPNTLVVRGTVLMGGVEIKS